MRELGTSTLHYVLRSGWHPRVALNKGEKGAAYGVVHAWGNRLEIRGPKIDDLLPNVQQRPPAAPCESDALDAPEPCERITLPLRKPKPKVIS